MRPTLWLLVAFAPSFDSGSTTAMRGMRSASSCLSAGAAAAVAELQAITRALAPRSRRIAASSRAKSRSSAGARSPYGKRAVSPRYRKSSWGSDTRHSCRTVSPPTPESKTATGSDRGSLTTANGRMTGGARAARGRLASELHLLHGLLDLPDDRVAQLLALVGAEALHRGDHSGHHQGDQQDQRHVLHCALPGLAARGGECGVDASHQAVHRSTSQSWMKRRPMVRCGGRRLQTRT